MKKIWSFLFICLLISLLVAGCKPKNALSPGSKSIKTSQNINTFSVAAVPVDQMYGFATIGGGTTGGTGGKVVNVTSGQQLYEILKARENKDNSNLIINLSGTITYSGKFTIKDTSNISIIGQGNNTKITRTGIQLSRAHNIIIRNIIFEKCKNDSIDDAISIESQSTRVWVDHCTFSGDLNANKDYYDGLVDIKHQSDYITVSWCKFYNHWKTTLVGHSRSETADKGHLRVTYHHNWFDGTNSRHPRIRYGQVHIYNNLYTNLPTYGVGVTCEAQVFVENNYFDNVVTPILISKVNDPKGTLSNDPEGYVKAINNYLTGGSGSIVENQRDRVFDPPYSYILDAAQSVKSIVMAGAGAGNISSDPVDPTPPPPSNDYSGYYKIRNRGQSHLYLDGMGRTANGSDASQWVSSSSYNQQWELQHVEGNYYKLVNRATEMCLDSIGRTDDHSILGQWSSSPHYNQQWELIELSGGYVKFKNRATEKCIDNGDHTNSGDPVRMWYDNQHYNQQWTLISITETTPPPSSSSWLQTDVGSPGAAGSATINDPSFVVKGAGALTSGSTDAFRFVYQQISGDFAIVSQLTEFSGAHADNGRAGIMIRDSLNANSMYMYVGIRPKDNQARFQYRVNTGASSGSTSNSSRTLPRYYKIERKGNKFNAYESSNGSSWTKIGGEKTAAMGDSVYIGFAVASGSSDLATAKFNGFTINK